MNAGFDWVPFYFEMARALLAYRDRQRELVSILKKSGVQGLVDQYPEGRQVELTEIDPFTFLALLNKQSHRVRARILAQVKQLLGVQSGLPTGFLGIPKADARQTWLFPYQFERGRDDVSKLWDLYEAVLSEQRVSEEVFAAAREVKYVGKAKLTQAIFRAAPEKFFPVDKQTTVYLAGLRLPNSFASAEDYQELCALVRKRVRKPLYEQSHDAWLLNQPKKPNAETDYQLQVLAAATKKKTFVDTPGGTPLPKVGKAGLSGGGFLRDPRIAAAAILDANFKCEIDPRHHTFVSNAKGRPYVEAHHLIPFGRQGGFEFSLDVPANIVSLCPNCHRLLHHGTQVDKAPKLVELFAQRKTRLLEKGLRISEADLLKLYRRDLLENDT